ncbi:hypothetical protein CY35_08G089800 [Sphagnum magellanicum]|nr:hypothetical protein CY35_08G089800 [Sphagnum magellanicum]
MINALETALTFLKNVREIFGKADGRTSNCPRCQGSGLLTNRSGWGCGQKMKQHSHLPVNIQLYNGKYPGSKCKLTSYKPSTYGISELLSDQPDYLGALENGSNLVEEESSPMETAEDISVPGEGFQKMPFWTTLSAGSSHHLRFYARTSTSLSFPDLSASLHSQDLMSILKPQGAESGNFSTSEGPLLSNLWGPHSLRQVRNWIREKAQKEAKDKPKVSEAVHSGI